MRTDLTRALNALDWYKEMSESMARYSIAGNTTAMMAVVQALALDAGKRAELAIKSLEELL